MNKMVLLSVITVISLKFVLHYTFETLIYFINRMPTPVLCNKFLFEFLFHQTFYYSFLCTFGCLCFPFLPLYNAHKLDFRSTPYVFLGCSSCHIGYRYLDLSSDHVYISHHVCFHEHSFPFLKTAHVSAILVPNPQSTSPSCLHALTHFQSQYPPTKTPSALFKQVPLPPVANMSIDHFIGSGSAAPDITTIRSATLSVEPFSSPSGLPSSSQFPT